MFASIINKLASGTQATKKIIDEVTEFRALKAEINKARCVLAVSYTHLDVYKRQPYKLT